MSGVGFSGVGLNTKTGLSNEDCNWKRRSSQMAMAGGSRTHRVRGEKGKFCIPGLSKLLGNTPESKDVRVRFRLYFEAAE